MNQKDYKKSLAEQAEAMTSQDILDRYGITEYTAEDLVTEFETAMNYKSEQARIFKILDAADHSDIWKVFNRKLPAYVQTPTANLITVIKEATKASIMPTAYAGEFRPLTINAKNDANVANRFFQMKWNASNMDEVNSEAADYAFLHGTSGVLFGWNDNIVDFADVANPFSLTTKAQFQSKAYHPSNVFPDPSGTTVEEMRYLFFAERKSKDFLKTIPRFANAMYNIENVSDSYGNTNGNYIPDKAKQSDRDIVTFLTCYKRVMRLVTNPVTNVQEYTPCVDIIYMAGRHILDVSKSIQPAIIPFVPLYDDRIPNNFWGISKCYKVLSLVIALNQLDSIEATAYGKNQNPAEFINAVSGLNIAEYQAKRNNPDTAFTVNCDPRAVQSYAQPPNPDKGIDTFRQYLITMIQNVSGVDAAYLGRSYGSIQTTGGVQQAVDRATMRDNNRIKAIDKFIRKEIEIMTQFYILKGTIEKFHPKDVKNAENEAIELEFNPTKLINRDDIELVVSNCAPRSNASFEDAAYKLFELQMKYLPGEKGYPDLITPEELVGWLNIPKSQQNVLIDRMRNQMENMKVEEYTAVLTAIGILTQGGMPVEQAIQEVAAQIEASAVGQLPATNVNPSQPMPR